ncbi:hypothetical protein RSAG8_08721, partial [Rhizoctonia solani AG-8 WAC10335]
MNPTSLPTHPAINWNTVLDDSEPTDTTIVSFLSYIPDDFALTPASIVLNYKPSELDPELHEPGQGTAQGDPFSTRSRLVPVPRWLAPKPISSFDVPQRQSSFPLRDPRKYKNFRALCWMHTESRLLVKSPLNDTAHRAFMPARPNIPLEDSMFRLSCPSNTLHAFGSILPGSTLQSYQLSVPPPRDTKGRVHPGPPKAPHPIRVVIPIPPPRVTAKGASHPCLIIVHRMNLEREHGRNTANIRTELVQSEQTLTAQRNDLSPAGFNSDLKGKTYNQRSYSPGTPKPNVKMTLPPATQRPTGGAHDSQSFTSTDTSTSDGSLSSQQHVSHGSTPPTTNTNYATLTDLTSIIWSTLDVLPDEQRQSPVAPDPKPRQKRPRAPAPRSVPSTRVLRSMSKAESENASVPVTIPPNTSISRVSAPSTVRRQPRKESRAKQVSLASANASASASTNIISTTHGYNLRPRKRELGEDQAFRQGSKQASRPTKRRRV